MTFEQWKQKKGFPVNSTQEPLWRECWETAQTPLLERIDDLEQVITELQERDL